MHFERLKGSKNKDCAKISYFFAILSFFATRPFKSANPSNDHVELTILMALGTCYFYIWKWFLKNPD